MHSVLKEQKEKKMEELRSIPSVHQAQQAEQDLRTKITGLERRVQYGQMELVSALPVRLNSLAMQQVLSAPCAHSLAVFLCVCTWALVCTVL